jgi:leucyl aminopeptidase
MLNIEFIDTPPSQPGIRCSVVDKTTTNLPHVLTEALRQRPHDTVVEAIIEGSLGFYRHLAVRLEIPAESSRQQREAAGAALFKKASEGLGETLLIDLTSYDNSYLDIISGMLLGSWRFNTYKTSTACKKANKLSNVCILTANPQHLEKDFQRLKATLEGVVYARTLTSQPPNILYPAAYAEELLTLKDLGVEVEVLTEDDLCKQGMHAILAASKGSSQPARMVTLRWNQAPTKQRPVAIAGKGVCFDAGGICLKSTAQQADMKWDKAGAGIVAGVFKALALAKAPVNVVGVIGLIENMPDGNATKPGDIITTLSGQTIEIVDTDAEGRLVLADCLEYAQRHYNPCSLIDLGTLTIETFASLGGAYAGLYSNNSCLSKQLKDAGERSGDHLWELPMGPFFAKQIESSVADMKNCGYDLCGENGAAAEFLKRFVKDIPWAHLDISGVSWCKEDLPLCAKGVTGFGVRLLEEWLYSHHS